MKKLVVALIVLVVLVVAAVAAVPFLVPTDVVTARVVAAVEARTGRQLAIEGPVELAVFPDLAVRLADVRFSNPEGADRADMVSLAGLDVELALLPLLGGAVEIDRIVLRQPVITLEIDETGRANWQFDAAEDAAPAPPEPAGDGGGFDIRIGDARIVDGTITFVDRRDGRTFELTAVDLTVDPGDLGGPVSATGSALFNGEAVSVEASVDDAGVLTGGGAGKTPVRLALTAEPVTLAFEGTASAGAAPAARGDIDLSVPSVDALAAWLPLDLPADLPIDSVALAGAVEASPERIALAGGALSLDGIDVTGDLAVALAGDRPSVTGDLAITALDLDALLAEAEAPAEPAPPATGGAGQPAAPAAGEPATIDLSPLRAVDADIALDLAGITVRGTDVGSTSAAIRIQDGALTVSTTETAIFGGTAAVDLSASAGDPQTYAVDATLDAIDLSLLPVAVDGLGGLQGRATGDVAARSSGRTWDAILANLDPAGTLSLTNAAATYALPGRAEPLVLADLDTTIEGSADRVLFRDLALTADGVAAAGQVALGLGGPRPSVSGDLRLGRLDLDRYLAPDAGAPEDAGGQAGGGAAGGGPTPTPTPASEDGGWSTAPIDLSALTVLDADLDLAAAEGLTVRGVDVGPTTLAIDLADGDLAARLGETPVFGGTVSGTIGVVAGTPHRYEAALTVAGVQAGPLLETVADLDRLVGTMNGSVDLTASGNSQLEIVRDLGGDGAILVSDGAITGINIAAMLRNAAGAFDASNRGEAQQTDFAELGGTFRIDSGLLTTEDLRMLAPLFRVEGSGRSDIPERTLAFRLVPRLVASIEGQGGQADLGGVAVPIVVTGTYDDIAFTPDLAGAIQNIVQDPASVDRQLDALGEQAEQLKGRIGDDPSQAIRGLLQGLTGGAPPAPAEQPGAQPPAETAPAPEQQDPARQLLEGILGGDQPAEEGGAQPADPVEQLRGLFGN